MFKSEKAIVYSAAATKDQNYALQDNGLNCEELGGLLGGLFGGLCLCGIIGGGIFWMRKKGGKTAMSG